jgi:hypothetical protein
MFNYAFPKTAIMKVFYFIWRIKKQSSMSDKMATNGA